MGLKKARETLLVHSIQTLKLHSKSLFWKFKEQILVKNTSH